MPGQEHLQGFFEEPRGRGLGAVGNGYVVFPTIGGADLPGELILAVHSRCYKVMTDILSLDDLKAHAL